MFKLLEPICGVTLWDMDDLYCKEAISDFLLGPGLWCTDEGQTAKKTWERKEER